MTLPTFATLITLTTACLTRLPTSDRWCKLGDRAETVQAMNLLARHAAGEAVSATDLDAAIAGMETLDRLDVMRSGSCQSVINAIIVCLMLAQEELAGTANAECYRGAADALKGPCRSFNITNTLGAI